MSLTRRNLLRNAASFALSDTPATGNTVVVIWLRGGIDGLSAVAPLVEDDFLDARGQLAVTPDAALPLDDRFGLHPAMAPLHELFTDGHLGVVHAIGNPEPTRSHFAAMDELERGTPGSFERTDGWLGRWLRSSGTSSSEFAAVGIGTMLPASLRGHTEALAIRTIEDFGVDTVPADRGTTLGALAALHLGVDPLAREAAKALSAVDTLSASGAAAGDGYPGSPLGQGLAQVAALVRAEVGLEVATVDGGGWDTHTAMGAPGDGTMHDQLADLAGSLAAFAAELSTAGMLDRVTVVTMSEFGRRVAANASGGTDHGRGTVSVQLGGGVAGGQVHGTWPGLAPDVLERGDLAVTTDWRDLLAEVFGARLRPADLGEVFPGHTVRPVGAMA